MTRINKSKAQENRPRFTEVQPQLVVYVLPQNLLDVFFHYTINNYKVGANLPSAQLTFTQELLPSSSKWFCPRPTSTYKYFAYTREHSNSQIQVYEGYTSGKQTLYEK